jgi:TetR/AcrR family transcriptional regulator, mexJK operon transcriptional repressor
VGNEIEDAEPPPPGARRGAGGRPTREDAARRDERLLQVATTMFMERGFEGTSIDAVAEAAGVSKPTVYARYRDKRDLFTAVLRGRIQSWLAPLSAAAEAQAGEVSAQDIETTLHDISREMVILGSAPGAAALQRILAAQALQFPELVKLAYEEGWQRGVRAIADLLRKFAASGQISVDDPEITADLFLNLVLGRPARLALYGIGSDPEVQERRRHAAVKLFLNGVKRPRS